jgi:hypothetical protein
LILVLLQNAWSGYYTRISLPDEEVTSLRSKVWAREDWLEATWASASGRTLRKLLDGVPKEKIWIDDTTLMISELPEGNCPADPNHVARLLAMPDLELVIACGKQAESAVIKKWAGRLLIMPHPAYRLLNRDTVRAANGVILSGNPYRCRIRPVKPSDMSVSYDIIPLPEEAKS